MLSKDDAIRAKETFGTSMLLRPKSLTDESKRACTPRSPDMVGFVAPLIMPVLY